MVERILFVVVVSCMGMVVALSDAIACSVDMCSVTEGMVSSDEKVVPANTPGLIWYPVLRDTDSRTLSDRHIEIWEIDEANDTERQVGFEVLPWDSTSRHLQDGYFLQLHSELQVGATYVVHADLFACEKVDENGEEDWLESVFYAGKPAPLPERLGTLVGSEQRYRRIRLAAPDSCHKGYDVADAAVFIKFDESAKPWQNVFIYETYVNGELWEPRNSMLEIPIAGASWAGRGSDIIYRVCDTEGKPDPETGGLPPGLHVVQMVARIPGVEEVFATNRVQIEVACEHDTEYEVYSPIQRIDAEQTSSNSAGGCSIQPVRKVPGAMLSWVFGGVVLIALRRRL